MSRNAEMFWYYMSLFEHTVPNISDTHVVLHNFINSFLNYGSGRTLKHSGQTRFDINFNEIIYKFINGYNEIDVKTVFAPVR